MPKNALTRPLEIDLPEIAMMTDSPNTASMNISPGPNDIAMPAIVGERNVITSAPMMPPQKEENIAMESARPACPFWHIGYPSSSVAAAAGVPGAWMRMAEIDPPYMPPQ